MGTRYAWVIPRGLFSSRGKLVLNTISMEIKADFLKTISEIYLLFSPCILNGISVCTIRTQCVYSKLIPGDVPCRSGKLWGRVIPNFIHLVLLTVSLTLLQTFSRCRCWSISWWNSACWAFTGVRLTNQKHDLLAVCSVMSLLCITNISGTWQLWYIQLWNWFSC